MSRTFDRQVNELRIRVAILNRFTELGRSQTVAVAESFFQLLKREHVCRKTYAARQEARSDVFSYIEMFYQPHPQTFVCGWPVSDRVREAQSREA